MAAFSIQGNVSLLGMDPEAIVEACDDSARASRLPQALLGVGLATATMATYAAVLRRPGGQELAYYFLGLGGAFVAGVTEMWAALWISGDVPARRRKGKVILYASVVPLVIAGGLGGFTVVFN
ncbi:uncharacterized protein LOC119272733 [Triticum dicoccoides]|uniref:uncharacterized protein LOC119272733 n=1 Tax=Triticum dicoccoides TaxID=85692 RepID=UPI0018906F06|nr:uncharacterized protein LOC119272733 [Triticum dicoccoides]